VAVPYLGEHRDGTLAQWVSVPAPNVFPMPAGLSFTEAAALGRLASGAQFGKVAIRLD
jgi:NADPH:quinone reductase-like Zn-dependent oxidoreductase